ncbi:hypothetical protein [Kitasatospora cineracea]|uniref:Uncharacterized protein n=1 Tax=Kitasatospora cineracea TaxID=88074 RepID=A0A3N4RJW7_9ACTN|nr:hypothetical protein [Kitasatospora cineracea]RPE27330.1 hypothetical protein EDD38_7475 [Kitasatospora cineracea]
MTRPLTVEETTILNQLASGYTVGQLAALAPSRARDIRNTAARARRALGARSIDEALQIHRAQQQETSPARNLTAAADRLIDGTPLITDSNLAQVLSQWLEAAAARERANEAAAARVYTTPAEQAAWLEDHRDHHALAVARQILGDQP